MLRGPFGFLPVVVKVLSDLRFHVLADLLALHVSVDGVHLSHFLRAVGRYLVYDCPNSVYAIAQLD